MMPRFKLGTCCMIDDDFHYKSITRSSFSKNSDFDNLWSLWKSNIEKTEEALMILCSEDPHFHYFRISSSLFPLATASKELWDFYCARLPDIRSSFANVGNKVRALSPHFRLTTHPGQFCVINSKSPDVVKNSIRELECHVAFMESFGLPWSINIHLSGKDEGAKDRMIGVANADLPDTIKNHLSLENDEKSSSISDIIEVCKSTGLLVCYDFHHEAVNRTFKGQEYFLSSLPEEDLIFIEDGWKKLDLTPAFHLSNRANEKSIKGDACAHSDYLYEEGNCAVLPLLDRGWALEVEAKAKLPAAKKFLSDLAKNR